jgi:hypothetical protein
MSRALAVALALAALAGGVAAGGCGGRSSAARVTTGHGHGYHPKEGYSPARRSEPS